MDYLICLETHFKQIPSWGDARNSIMILAMLNILGVRHRRFRFSLRALFIFVTLVACWLSYQISWIRQRHVAMGTIAFKINCIMDNGGFPIPPGAVDPNSP